MKRNTKAVWQQVALWLVWWLVATSLLWQGLVASSPATARSLDGRWEVLAGSGVWLATVVPQAHLPWWPRGRYRKWAWRRYRAARAALRRARWRARLAWLVLRGSFTLATLVDWLTQCQLRRRLGLLPVLYALVETLEVRRIINRHVPTRAEVDYGTVALVLILNRLSAPRPLYQVADWLGQTVLVHTLGVPARKFNDDRLGRTLDALAPHAEAIWQEVVQRALVGSGIDVSFLFYDLTAFVVHGQYAASELVDFGFAHNTPSNKRKVKVGLTTTGDGHVPVAYRPWRGNTADRATVQRNLARLQRLLARHGYELSHVLLTGDRAMLDGALAQAYDQAGARYLAGLEARQRVHQALLQQPSEAAFARLPLAPGYWGVRCRVPFQLTPEQPPLRHYGLVVLSGPMRSARRRSRAQALRALQQELEALQAKVGQPYYRTTKQLLRSARSRLRHSSVGDLMTVWTTTNQTGQVALHWQIEVAALRRAMRCDGRYLLVTNDPDLTPRQMLQHYRQKDGTEKRFRVSKQQLRVQPLYLHKDRRIEGMLLVNMLALLAYSLLERQVRQAGLALTLRQVMRALEELTLIETHCHDGSVLYRFTPTDAYQQQLLRGLADLFQQWGLPRLPSPPPPEAPPLLSGPDPGATRASQAA